MDFDNTVNLRRYCKVSNVKAQRDYYKAMSQVMQDDHEMCIIATGAIVYPQ